MILMDDYYLKNQLIGEIQETIRIKELNVELMETLTGNAIWILKYCEKNNIRPPNLKRLLETVSKSRTLTERMYQYFSPQNKHPFTTPEDSTEPCVAMLCKCDCSFYSSTMEFCSVLKYVIVDLLV